MKTQNSLLLLEEKMELLADLQQKADKCRSPLHLLNTSLYHVSLIPSMRFYMIISKPETVKANAK